MNRVTFTIYFSEQGKIENERFITCEGEVGDMFFDVIPNILFAWFENRPIEEDDDGDSFDIIVARDTYDRLKDVRISTAVNYQSEDSNMSNQNYARDIDDMEMQCAPTNTIGASTMSQEVISNITYYRGRNIKDMSKVQLIDALKGTEAEIKALDEIQTESAAIAKEKDKLKGALAVVVAELDARS